MFPIALLTLFATLCTAEVICNPRVPPNLIPPLQSCDYAIRRLEVVQQGCGPDPIVFSPTAAGPNVLSLPAIYVGAGPGYTPPTPVWCAIMILWQPRPQARPALDGRDVFRFSKILGAANGVLDRCLRARPGSRSMIGREWVEPNQWVEVQFGGVFGPEAVRGQGNFSGDDGVGFGGEELMVMLADGTNVSVVPSAFNEVRGCGGLLSLGNETAGNIE
ncbi:MAG: hypothetical protein ASARMPRED_005098 [Alectoria sarmentosa]|nr:MAG: hypothetical protein ASARMPRED_005098 [Alectoria sarmentosa]